MGNNLLKFIVFCLITFVQYESTIVHAATECIKPVTHLNEGTLVPCEGFLFSPKTELEVRIKVANYDNMVTLTNNTQEYNNILYNRVTNLQEQNIILSQELNGRSNIEAYKLLGVFTLGSLITTLIVKNLK
jgi:hypothetical protein